MVEDSKNNLTPSITNMFHGTCYFNKKGEAVVIYNTYCEIGCAKYFFLLVVSFMIQKQRKNINDRF